MDSCDNKNGPKQLTPPIKKRFPKKNPKEPIVLNQRNKIDIERDNNKYKDQSTEPPSKNSENPKQINKAPSPSFESNYDPDGALPKSGKKKETIRRNSSKTPSPTLEVTSPHPDSPSNPNETTEENAAEENAPYAKRGSMECPELAEYNCVCSNYAVEKSLNTSAKKNAIAEPKNFITSARINQLRRKALEAAKQHNTFTIRGCFHSIRKGLLERGWVEKFDAHRRNSAQTYCQSNPSTNTGSNDSEIVLPERKPGQSRHSYIFKCERNIVSRFLEHKPIDFLWCARKERSDFGDMVKNPGMMVSRLTRNPFTSKSGMCTVLRDFRWFFEEGTSELYYPRSYNMFLTDDFAEFVDNFRMSACIAMLRFLVETPLKSTKIEQKPGLMVPCSSIKFAIEKCSWYIRTCLHYDIDEEPPFDANDDFAWETFLQHHQKLTVEGGYVEPDAAIGPLLNEAAAVLTEVQPHWAQYNLDGVHNIWIVKPSNRCRGRGIRLMNDLRKILAFVNPSNKGHWVVQKYIERPLIIHNCKFDIRQWFLVTSVQPMVIWMYRESYLRFSSQEFSLVNLHESVHLTNHAIQKRYRNGGTRDKRLPKENMWDCHTFQAYLRQIGQTHQWSERIYPGMQKALIGTMLASQDHMDRRANTFELFGADFMVSEDFQPWLIEINSSPDLAASTSVTARMCPQCLEDLVKVVIDFRANPKASTGEFELIYKQSIPPAPAYLGLDLYLVGTQLSSKALKRERATSISPRTNTFTNTVARTTRRPLRIPMAMVRSPRNCADIFPPDTQSTLSVSIKKSKRPSNATDKPPLPSNDENHTASHLDILIRNCSPRVDSNKAVAKPSAATRSSNRIIRNVLAPALRVLRDLKKHELIPDSNRRHASCGPRLSTGAPAAVSTAEANTVLPDVNVVPIEKADFRCVGRKMMGQDSLMMSGDNMSSWHDSQVVGSRKSPSKRIKVYSRYRRRSATVGSNSRKDKHRLGLMAADDISGIDVITRKPKTTFECI